MRRLRLALRLLTIQRTLMRHGLDELVWATHLFRPVVWLRRLIPRRRRRDELGVRLRHCLEDLGPIFVKFGQAVSTRRDLLPQPVADELSKLQDQVPPFPSAQATAIVEEALGRPVTEVYAEFSREPLAAASIAQVHAARLRSGEAAVVKILRPGVHESIRQDLAVLYALARLASRYSDDGRRLRPVEVVAEFEKTLFNELDLMREAANASQLRRNFNGSDQLYVPEVYWEYCRKSVLTMERISGIPISDRSALEACGANIRRLAHNGVKIFFTQVFEHNFFHADMHPGNVFVDARRPDYPRYIAVDFGIVGSLSDRDQMYLAENFLAFFKRDYRRVAELHIDSGWVPAGTRATELEGAIRAVCEPIFDKPLKDISFGLVLMRLFETARQFNMEVQPQLVLLQKTLLNIEGLGRQLYPELDIWKTARPILDRWLKRRVSPQAHLSRLITRWPQISQDLLLLPDVLHRVVRQLAEIDPRPAPPRAPPGPRHAAAALIWPGLALAAAGVAWLLLGNPPAWPGWLALGAGAAIASTPAWMQRD